MFICSCKYSPQVDVSCFKSSNIYNEINYVLRGSRKYHNRNKYHKDFVTKSSSRNNNTCEGIEDAFYPGPEDQRVLGNSR